MDGGACKNNVLMQFQSDILDLRINRPAMVETTAMGAAFLAGLQTGYWKNSSEIRRIRKVDRIFSPGMGKKKRGDLWEGWKKAVNQVITK